jgi:hypothetical protein
MSQNTIAQMRTQAIAKSNFGTEQHTVWTLATINHVDIVVEVTATAASIIYAATDGIIEIVTESEQEFLAELQ